MTESSPPGLQFHIRALYIASAALVLVTAGFLLSSLYNHFKPAADHSHEPQIGLWAVRVGPHQCREIYDFHADDTLIRYSGNQTVYWHYLNTVQTVDRQNWEFRGHVESASGGRDCQGNATEDTGHEHNGIMEFSPDFQQMRICDMDHKRCSPIFSRLVDKPIKSVNSAK
jgi:hypothetical protein